MTSPLQSSFIRPPQLWLSLGLRAGQSVVHLGCGVGYYVIPAAQLVGKEGQVIGIDIRSDLLAEVENRARRAEVGTQLRTIRANLENERGSTLPDRSADWVLVANILHQAKPSALLNEAARLVKAQGTVVVIEWTATTTPLGPPPAARVSKQEAIAFAQKSGLTLKEEITPSPYHYGLLLSVKQPHPV